MKPRRKPRRKALIVSVLDYPYVGQKHGGESSYCFFFDNFTVWKKDINRFSEIFRLHILFFAFSFLSFLTRFI